MKKVAVCCLVGLLALAVGCRRSGQVVLLKELPEIDTSALDTYADWGPGEISTDRMWVKLNGKAKKELGLGIRVRVKRFIGEELLDTVPGQLRLLYQPPAETPAPPSPGGGAGGAVPLRSDGPTPPPPIMPGDEVTISVDATTNQGVITKLVLTPDVVEGTPGR